MKGVLGIVFLLGAPFAVHAEIIRDFDVTLTPYTDSSFLVTEVITYDFEGEAKHGIFRYIPTKHPEVPSKWYLERYLDIDIKHVLMDGKVAPYVVEDEADRMYLKIGDPDATITGPHVYSIEYMVHGGISKYLYGGADLYWNATGNDWVAPILHATVRVRDTNNLFTDTHACYIGAMGATASCGQPVWDGDTLIFTAKELNTGVGLTIAQGIDTRAMTNIVQLERAKPFLLWATIIGIWTLIMVLFAYRHETKYKYDAPQIAMYEPFRDLEPMYLGLLMDDKLDPRDISAGIIYLAERGFLKISRTEKKVLFLIEVEDFEITLTRAETELTSPFHLDILHLIFEPSAAVGTVVALSDLKKNISVGKRNRLIIMKLTKDAHADLVAKGYIQENKKIWFVALGLAIVSGAILWLEITALFPFMILAVVTCIPLFFIYRRRTRLGYEALMHLKGFKEFLSVTDKERFDFHNAPEKNADQFMQYLPYAVAFGVEDKWAEVFKDMSIPQPSWYDGGSANAFNAASLTSSLGGFSTAFASSSGSSASSGGGSSGGGGGGGGGGSW